MLLVYIPPTDTQKTFQILSYGADGKPGGSDFDADLSSIDPLGPDL